MAKIIGIEQRKGIYEGNNFDNVLFHCTDAIPADKGVGLSVKTVKVKYSVVTASAGKQLNEKELVALIGKEVQFFYNEYKNVSLVQGLA